MSQITIIVPVYKVEPYLHRCVDSILDQTLTDFELILVDDGSPDGCGAICDEYATQDTRIHVIHQPNGGLSAARNAGIDWAFANSNSQWLSFIDSDDWVHPQYLEYLYRAVKENNAKISLCEYEEAMEQTPVLPVDFTAELHRWDELLIHKNVHAVVAVNKLYAKELFDEFRYPVGKIHEDEFLTYKLLHRAGFAVAVEQVLYFYYQNPSGITKGSFSLARFDGAEALLERVKYVRAIKNTELNQFCVRQFLGNAWKNLQAMRSSKEIAPDQKQKKEREIKQAFRVVLLRYGWKYAPPWVEVQYYDFAFPVLNAFARQSVRLYRKLKGK